MYMCNAESKEPGGINCEARDKNAQTSNTLSNSHTDLLPKIERNHWLGSMKNS